MLRRKALDPQGCLEDSPTRARTPQGRRPPPRCSSPWPLVHLGPGWNRRVLPILCCCFVVADPSPAEGGQWPRRRASPCSRSRWRACHWAGSWVPHTVGEYRRAGCPPTSRTGHMWAAASWLPQSSCRRPAGGQAGRSPQPPLLRCTSLSGPVLPGEFPLASRSGQGRT